MWLATQTGVGTAPVPESTWEHHRSSPWSSQPTCLGHLHHDCEATSLPAPRHLCLHHWIYLHNKPITVFQTGLTSTRCRHSRPPTWSSLKIVNCQFWQASFCLCNQFPDSLHQFFWDSVYVTFTSFHTHLFRIFIIIILVFFHSFIISLEAKNLPVHCRTGKLLASSEMMKEWDKIRMMIMNEQVCWRLLLEKSWKSHRTFSHGLCVMASLIRHWHRHWHRNR